MTRREARREAWRLAASIVQQALEERTLTSDEKVEEELRLVMFALWNRYYRLDDTGGQER